VYTGNDNTWGGARPRAVLYCHCHCPSQKNKSRKEQVRVGLYCEEAEALMAGLDFRVFLSCVCRSECVCLCVGRCVCVCVGLGV